MPRTETMMEALCICALALTQGGQAMAVDSTEAPSDFELRYEWKEASIPPPHHYEYTIRLGPGTQGEIHFSPDYPLAETPEWIESFDLSPQDMAGLWSLVKVARTKIQDLPEPTEEVIVGGVVERLEITAGGETVSLPLNRKSVAIAEVREAVRSLLPKTLWEQMMLRRVDYWDGEADEVPPSSIPHH